MAETIKNGQRDYQTENALIEKMAGFPLSQYEVRIVLAVFRKTLMFGKSADRIANKQIEEMTGLHKSHVSRTLSILKIRNIIQRDQAGFTAINTALNEWSLLPCKRDELPKRVTIGKLPKRATDVTQAGNKKGQKVTRAGGHKESIKKTIKEKSPDSKKSGRSLKFTDDDLRLSKLLVELLDRNNPTRKPTSEKQINSWADSVRLMREQDNRNHHDIEKLLRWSQDHNFWKTVIESIQKFRAKYDKMTLQMTAEAQRKQKQASQYKDDVPWVR